MKIAGAVRVIKGQKVLPNGSTLVEHGITDGSTINIITETDEELKKFKVKLGPKEIMVTDRNSLRVRELKQQLIDCGIVGFSLSEFTLIISADDNKGINDDTSLRDESLPLHLCGVSNNTTLRIIGGRHHG